MVRVCNQALSTFPMGLNIVCAKDAEDQDSGLNKQRRLGALCAPLPFWLHAAEPVSDPKDAEESKQSA